MSSSAKSDPNSFKQEELVKELTLSVRESDWDVDTGLDMLTIDRLVVNAAGSIKSGVLLTGPNGPQGWNKIDNDPKFPLPGSHPFCLLGKIGTNYFFIRDGSQVNNPIANGRLLLRIMMICQQMEVGHLLSTSRFGESSRNAEKIIIPVTETIKSRMERGNKYLIFHPRL